MLYHFFIINQILLISGNLVGPNYHLLFRIYVSMEGSASIRARLGSVTALLSTQVSSVRRVGAMSLQVSVRTLASVWRTSRAGTVTVQVSQPVIPSSVSNVIPQVPGPDQGVPCLTSTVSPGTEVDPVAVTGSVDIISWTTLYTAPVISGGKVRELTNILYPIRF